MVEELYGDDQGTYLPAFRVWKWLIFGFRVREWYKRPDLLVARCSSLVIAIAGSPVTNPALVNPT